MYVLVPVHIVYSWMVMHEINEMFAVDVIPVSCPVCHVSVPERNINVHLDKCLKNDSEQCTLAK